MDVDVRFSGEFSADERAALRRRGTVYKDAFSVSAPGRGEEMGSLHRAGVLSWPETTYHVVRLTAESRDEAREQVIDTLEREPENLSVSEGL
jgi:hypothetical protein